MSADFTMYPLLRWIAHIGLGYNMLPISNMQEIRAIR